MASKSCTPWLTSEGVAEIRVESGPAPRPGRTGRFPIHAAADAPTCPGTGSPHPGRAPRAAGCGHATTTITEERDSSGRGEAGEKRPKVTETVRVDVDRLDQLDEPGRRVW